MIIRYIAGLAVALGAALLAILGSGGDPRFALDPPALAFMLGLPLLSALASAGPRGLGRALGLAFRPSAVAPPEELRSARNLICLMAKAEFLACAITFLVGNILMMRKLADRALLGATFGATFVPSLYGLLILAVLILPLRDSLDLSLAARAGSPALQPAVEEVRNPGRARALPRILAVILAVLLPLVLAGQLILIYDLPSICVVLFIPLGALLAGPGPAAALEAFKAVLGHARGGGDGAAEAGIVFASIRRSILLAAAYSLLAGTAYFFEAFFDRTRTGPNLAMVLLTALYAFLLLAALVLPMEAAAKRLTSRNAS